MSVAPPLMVVAAPPANGSSNSMSSSDVAATASSLPSSMLESVGQQLAALGLAVQPCWLRDALAIEMHEGALPQLQAHMRTLHAAGGAAGTAVPPAALVTACRDCAWSRALLSSLLRMGARRLPPLRTLPTPTLAGTHVLQLVECVDVAHSANQLAEKAQWEDRVWKLLLTDGQQLCAAFERRRCQSLSHAAMKPGVKLAIRDVPVRHGVLMLEPGNVEVLGGGSPPDDEESAKNAPNGVSVAAPPTAVAMQARAASAAPHVAAAAPPMASNVARQPLPGASAAAAAASSMAAQSNAVAPAAPAAFVAASTMMSPQQPQPQPSMWAIRSQQQAAAAAAAAGPRPPQQPHRQPAPSTLPPAPAVAPSVAATSFGRGGQPLPLSRDDGLDDEDAWMEEDEEAMRELEEEEKGRQSAAPQQLPVQQPSAPTAQPLFTATSLLASGSNGEEESDDVVVVDMDRGEDKDLPPLSQSMPGLETAPPILDYVSPVISKDTKHADETPMATGAAAAAASPAAHVPASALAPAADVFSLLTPPDRAPAPAAALTPQSVPTLTPMSAAPPFTPPSTAFSTVATVSSPAVSSTTVPAASSIPAAVQVKAEKGAAALESHSAAAAGSSSAAAASSSAAPAAAPSRSAPAVSSATAAAAPSRAASRSTTASPGKVKKEGGAGAGAGAGAGTLDAFLARGSRDKPPPVSSRCSSPASDGSSVMLVSPPKKAAPRPAPARGVKPEALAARFPAAEEDDDFLESTDAPAAPILPQMAPAPPASTPVPDEVSPAVLQRGREASQEAVSRLFPLKDPLRPHFQSLPYTFLHLLPTLAQRIERPLHVLVHAHIVGVCHIRLESQYELHVQIQDDHSACNLRFSPAYVEALLGNTADRLAQLADSVKETLYDKLQAKIEAPPGIMQLRIHPRVRDRGNKRKRNERMKMQLGAARSFL